MDAVRLQEFGNRYTAAWCSQNAASVAACFAESGSLTINDGAPAVSRAARSPFSADTSTSCRYTGSRALPCRRRTSNDRARNSRFAGGH